MSTRSYICKSDENGVRGVYCHWDGYPEHVGEMLLNYYSEADVVDKLIDLGSLSALYPKLEPSEGVEHTFYKPADGVTVAYCRDRGEPLEITEFKHDKHWREGLGRFWVNYVYVFHEGCWFFANIEDAINCKFSKLVSYFNNGDNYLTGDYNPVEQLKNKGDK